MSIRWISDRHVIFALLLAMAWLVPASGSARETDNGTCMRCHWNEGSIKRFENNEIVNTSINFRLFEKSGDGRMPCTDCHQGLESDHPARKYRSLKQFQTKMNRACRRCHDDMTLSKHEVHVAMLEKEQSGHAFICSGCHSAHSVRPVKGGPMSATEDEHCMNCHEWEVSMSFVDGSSHAFSVDVAELHASPHKDLKCSDCHHGFSKNEHPHRKFRSAKEFRLASSQMCKHCHYDKHTKLSESIHYDVIKKGRLDAPTCIECHGGHATTAVSKDRYATVGKCRKCHEQVYETYAQSVHGDALFNQHNYDVPICTDCHTAHSVQDPYASAYHEAIPDKCGSCHSDDILMKKYGLSTNVVKTYLADFHGVTLSFYRENGKEGYRGERPIAICTDCHGTHDIQRLSLYSQKVLKQKLLERCRACHVEATENFPDAWLSHYEPTLKSAPAVYIVKASYQILMPFMVIGIVLQILLHIWRYLVNR